MDSKKPKAILLYTQKQGIPDIAFHLSSIPLALASYLKFGGDFFSTMPATEKNIEHAFITAEFVVVGTHGYKGNIYTDDNTYIRPGKIVNEHMKHIYFGSCQMGMKRSAWATEFPNAKLIGYDGITYPITGWKYLVFESWLDLLKF